MRLEETQKALKKFMNETIRDARSNLKKKNSSGELSRSLKGSVKVSKNSIELDISMKPYGEYQDKGVSGTKKKYNTSYSYKSKMPPPKAFDKWIVKKGIAPRNEKGQFINRKSLAFAIAKSIQKNGIKPSLFLTKAFQKNIKKLDKDIVQKYGLDTERQLEIILQDVLK